MNRKTYKERIDERRATYKTAPTPRPRQLKLPQIGIPNGHPMQTAHAKNESPHMNAAIRERRPATEEISGLERNPVLETGDEAVWYAAV